MNTTILKNQIKSINYAKNLQKLLGAEDSRVNILKQSVGLLRGILKKSGIEYQREGRQQWENKIRKLEKQIKK